MADGVSCLRLFSEVLWDEAERAPAPASGVARAERGSRCTAPLAVETRWQHLPGAVEHELGHLAGRSPLGRRIGSGRELAFATFPLADLKRIGELRTPGA